MREKQDVLKFVAFLGITAFFVFTAFSFSFALSAEPSILINNGDTKTKIRKVALKLSGPIGVKQMELSNFENFLDAKWEDYQQEKTWYLDYGTSTKKVFVRFKDKDNKISELYYDSILLESPAMVALVEINGGQVSTDSRYVIVSSTYSDGVESFRVNHENSFTGISLQPVSRSIVWTLPAGSGNKSIFAQFKDASGEVKIVEKRIQYTEPARHIPEGSRIKSQTTTIYYFGFDGKLHPFPDSNTYHSWFLNFDDIVQVSDTKLRQYKIGESVCVRAGTWLVKFKSLPRVYAVEPGCVLQPIRSEVEAYIMYGSLWQYRIAEFDQIYQTLYTIKNFDITDKDKKIVDNDKDGIDAEKEKDYGSSDKKSDTDGDKLSDYEEIEYWFTDPNDSDTDDDGFLDGEEIMKKFSPLGEGALQNAPKNSYPYPVGALIQGTNNKYYYLASDGTLRLIEKNFIKDTFTSNNFQEKFAIWPPLGLSSVPEIKGGFESAATELIRPKIYSQAGYIIDL